MRLRGSCYASVYEANSRKSMIQKEKLGGSSYACTTLLFHTFVHCCGYGIPGVLMRHQTAFSCLSDLFRFLIPGVRMRLLREFLCVHTLPISRRRF